MSSGRKLAETLDRSELKRLLRFLRPQGLLGRLGPLIAKELEG